MSQLVDLKEKKAVLEKQMGVLMTNKAVLEDRMKTVETAIIDLGFESIEKALSYVKLYGPKFEQALVILETRTEDLMKRLNDGPPASDSIDL